MLTLSGFYLLVGGCGNSAIGVLVVLQPLRNRPEVEALVRICPPSVSTGEGDAQGAARTSVEGHVVRAAGCSLLMIPLVRALGAEPLRQVELLEQRTDRVLEHSAGVKAQPCENRRLQAGMALRACSPRSGGG